MPAVLATRLLPGFGNRSHIARLVHGINVAARRRLTICMIAGVFTASVTVGAQTLQYEPLSRFRNTTSSLSAMLRTRRKLCCK